jgi:long-subunit fatty acid transport protein
MHRDHDPAVCRRFAAASFMAILLAAAGAQAQTETIPRFDFSFSNPGARSLGFGGAFAALADDATAANANPAGLVQLTEPEVSVEARFWNRSLSFIAGGRFDGEPTGMGIDTRNGLVVGRDNRQGFGPSFASVVIPKGRWSFALYGHELAQFEEGIESQGIFSDEENLLPPIRSLAVREAVDFKVVTAGMAAGWRMNDTLSFGLGIVFSDVSLIAQSEIFLPDDDSVEALFGRISFLPDRLIATSTLSMEGSDVTINAGVLGRISEQVSAGLFYRQGAKAEGTAGLEFGPAAPFTDSFRHDAVLKVPDVAGAGLAFRSKDGRVTLATEVDHVAYSGLIQVMSTEEREVVVREYEDAWEYHLGAEYALLQSKPILAFRAGAWVENGADLEEKKLTHLSGGIGIALEPFQVDLAGDFSKERDNVSLSFIYTF